MTTKTLSLTTLERDFGGEIVLPDSDSYDESRRVWNGMIDRRPAAILRPKNAAEVAKVVSFAREEGALLAVRGGGHNVAGTGTCDGGIVLDLSNLRGISVDAARRVCRAEGGARWRDVDSVNGEHGLATTGGAISSTGVGGLTLGGGYGYLARRYGMVCDNLLKVELVTAGGELITASENENPDLFWGLRGGGGNFGVATAFEYRLHPVEKVYGGMILFPFEKASAVLKLYAKLAPTCGDETSLLAGLLPTPDGGKAAGVILAHTGEEKEGEAIVNWFRQLGPIMDQVGWMPYPHLQQMLDGNYGPGLRNYWKSSYTHAIDEDLADMLVDEMAGAPAICHIVIEHFGGAISRVDPEATAYGHRSANFNVLILGLGIDPSTDEAIREWSHTVWTRLQPYATGTTYVNYLNAGESISLAYGSANYERLARLKHKFDPNNLFRANQNIQPMR